MKTYNYYEAVKADVENYVLNEVDLSQYEDSDELAEFLNDELFCEDSVTGNASGSYTFNAWEAEENLCHNLDLLTEANAEFGGDMDVCKDGAEACDVTIRCFLLPQVISEVVNEIEFN